MKKDSETFINLRAFDCVCQQCGHRFVGVNFPDFEYGRRIFRTKGGEFLALWIGYEDQVGDEFDALLRKIIGIALSPRKSAMLFDLTFGIACDPINGEPVDPSQRQVCPNCGSDQLKTLDIIPKKMIETKVYLVRHTQWLEKSVAEREKEIRAALGGLNLTQQP
jgi:hypothetical protein